MRVQLMGRVRFSDPVRARDYGEILRAHNPKVGSSNLPPATNVLKALRNSSGGLFDGLPIGRSPFGSQQITRLIDVKFRKAFPHNALQSRQRRESASF